jgi:hypothetical protein
MGENDMLEKLMEIYNEHRYATQRWSSTSGYDVRCSCGQEFHVGLIEQEKRLALPESSDRLCELTKKFDDENYNPQPGERTEMRDLLAEHRKNTDAIIDENDRNTRKILHAPIQQHVRDLFTALLKGDGSKAAA